MESLFNGLVDLDCRIVNTDFVQLALEVVLKVVSVDHFYARFVIYDIGAFFFVKFECLGLHR